MRLFIAVDFEPLRPILLAIQRQIADDITIRLKLASDYHCTLHFLGEVEKEKVSIIQQELSGISFSPFRLNLSSIGFFPSESVIQVIWIGLSPEQDIAGLAARIREKLGVLSSGSSKEFVPHITLARVKRLKDPEAALERIKAIAVEPAGIEIKKFHLLQSTLTPHGPEYRVIASFPKDGVN